MLCRTNDGVRIVHNAVSMQAGDLAMRATYTNGTAVVREFYAYDHEGRVTAVTNALGNVTNILHTARSTPNTAFLHDTFGNVTNAIDTAGNAWQFSYA